MAGGWQREVADLGYRAQGGVWGDQQSGDGEDGEEYEDDQTRHRGLVVAYLQPDVLHPSPDDDRSGPEGRDNAANLHHLHGSHVDTLGDLDSRIEPEEEEIGQEVRDDDGGSTDYDDELEERIIEASASLECPKPDSLVSKNDLKIGRAHV